MKYSFKVVFMHIFVIAWFDLLVLFIYWDFFHSVFWFDLPFSGLVVCWFINNANFIVVVADLNNVLPYGFIFFIIFSVSCT